MKTNEMNLLQKALLKLYDELLSFKIQLLIALISLFTILLYTNIITSDNYVSLLNVLIPSIIVMRSCFEYTTIQDVIKKYYSKATTKEKDAANL